MLRSLLIIGILISELAVAKSSPMKIAVVYPKTGPKSDFVCITKGVVAAEGKKLNVKVEYFDSENEVLATAKVANEIAAKKFDLVVGTRTSQEAIAASNILNEAKIPFVVPIASNPQVTEGKKYSLGLISDSTRYAMLMAYFAATELKPKRVAVIVNASIPYSTYYASEFPKQLAKFSPKTKVTTHEIIKGFQEFDDLVSRIEKDKPDLVYMPIYTIDALSVFHAFAKTESTIKMLSHASMNDGRELFKDGVSKRHPELYFNSVWSYKVEGPEKDQYRKVHSKWCPKNDDNLRTVAGYDVMAWVLRGIDRNRGKKGLELVSALKNVKYDGLLGNLRFDGKAQSALRPLQIFRVKSQNIGFFKKVNR